MTPEGIQQKIFFGYAKAASKLGAYFSLYRSSTPINPIQISNFITVTQMSQSVSWDYMKASNYGNSVFNACLDAQSKNSPNSCRVGDYLVPTVGDDVQYYASSIAVSNPGVQYAIGDIIILQGGSYTSTVELIVTSVAAGLITGVSITQAGVYNFPLPSNPLTEYYTSGLGANATFNITWTGLSGIDNNNTYFVQSLQFDLPPRVVSCNNIISIIRPTQPTGAGDLGYVGYTAATAEVIMSEMPASVLLEGGGKRAETKLPTDTNEPNWIILLPNLGNVNVLIGDIITDQTNQDYVIYNNELTDLGWRIKASQVVNNG